MRTDLAPSAPPAGLSVPSGTPAPVGALTALGFGALSRLRGKRMFHPHGLGFTATLRVARRPGYQGVPLLDQAGEHPAICRLSRATGLPEPLPDILGIAFRLPDLHAPGRHQDFLLATSARGPLLHHLLLPGVGGFTGQTFSSLLPYRFGRHVRLVEAEGRSPSGGSIRTFAGLDDAARAGVLSFTISLSALSGGRAEIAELVVGERLPDDETERLAFTPWHTGGGIQPAGPFQGIRQPAYRGSQRGRGLRGAEIP